MTHPTAPSAKLLPHPAPACPYSRLLLFGIRRMAVGGINDAQAAHAFFTGFGLSYRRPLVLLRALMTEVSRVSARRLVVAPFCCARASDDEYGLMAAISAAPRRPDKAHDALCRLLHVRNCLGLTTSAEAVARSFADAGMPLHEWVHLLQPRRAVCNLRLTVPSLFALHRTTKRLFVNGSMFREVV